MSKPPDPPVLGFAEPELISGKDLARRLNVSRDTIQRLTKNEIIPHVYVGEQVRFDFSEVLTALRARAAEQKAKAEAKAAAAKARAKK